MRMFINREKEIALFNKTCTSVFIEGIRLAALRGFEPRSDG